MRKSAIAFLTFCTLILGQVFIPVLPAHSVEFGQDATGDPNAVHIQGNTSGFLYSERIILTAAHVLDQLKIETNGDTDGFVYAPGVTDKTNAKRYKIVKAYLPKTYVNLTNNTQPIDDFAVVVLNEDMPVKMKVAIATENQMLSYAQNKTRVELVGYGLQSGSQRSNPQELTRAPHKLSTHLLTPEMMTNHYNQFSQVRPPFWNKIEWGTTLNNKTGTLCNGDSGSGYFVEGDNIRYYVGTAGNGLADSNCQADGVYRPGPGGPIGWFPSPNKFLDLIKTAEIFVADEKQKELRKVEDAKAAIELKAKQEAEAKVALELQARLEAEAKAAAELKAKQEAEAKAAADLKAKQEADAKAAATKKATITCVKGKLTKKVTSVKPKCPAGYKKK